MFSKACLLFTQVRVERHIVGVADAKTRLERMLALEDEIMLTHAHQDIVTRTSSIHFNVCKYEYT